MQSASGSASWSRTLPPWRTAVVLLPFVEPVSYVHRAWQGDFDHVSNKWGAKDAGFVHMGPNRPLKFTGWRASPHQRVELMVVAVSDSVTVDCDLCSSVVRIYKGINFWEVPISCKLWHCLQSVAGQVPFVSLGSRHVPKTLEWQNVF